MGKAGTEGNLSKEKTSDNPARQSEEMKPMNTEQINTDIRPATEYYTGTQISATQLEITEKLLMNNLPLNRARMLMRAEAKTSGKSRLWVFRMAQRPHWFAYKSAKVGRRYRDVAALYTVEYTDRTDSEVRELILADFKEMRAA
jgi:hypothetical protein